MGWPHALISLLPLYYGLPRLQLLPLDLAPAFKVTFNHIKVQHFTPVWHVCWLGALGEIDDQIFHQDLHPGFHLQH
jgi:hypothetical protein